MQDIAIAFACATAAATLLGTLVDTSTASTAFGTIFAAVFAVLERGHKRQEKRREEQLERQIDEIDQIEASEDTQGRPRPEPPRRSTIQLELEEVRKHAALPLIDWRRTVIGAVGSTVIVLPLLALTLAFAFVAALGGPVILPFVPLLLAVGVLLGAGYWVGRSSRASGFLGAVIVGSVVGVSLPLVILLTNGEFENVGELALGFTAFTGTGVLLASIGGWLGYRRRG